MQPALKSSPEVADTNTIVLANPMRLTDPDKKRILDLLTSLMAKAPSDNTVESVAADIGNRQVQLWKIGDWKGLAVTRLYTRPVCEVLVVEWLSARA